MKTFTETPADYVPGTGALHAVINTNHGTMIVQLFEDQAPNTVANFVGLATGKRAWTDPDTGETKNDPYFDGIVFHRVIPGFMIQGGDPTGTGRGGPGYKFADEFHPELTHESAGTLSMANSGKNTNGSQFFVTDGATPHLDGGHAVFGRVIEGLDVLKTIANVPRDAGDRPNDDVVMTSVTIERR